jgi:hypothetical protein
MTEAFLVYPDYVLGPTLMSGDLVALDNLPHYRSSEACLAMPAGL